MAVAFDGFSIRDYTAKMRSIDVFKCWPFGTDELSRKDVESWLPPMTVPKFRCGSKELESLRSNCDDDEKVLGEETSRSESESVKSDEEFGVEEERLEMVCPVCRVFNAATLTAVNAHIDGCLAQTMREERRQMRMMSSKSKSKVPKKRSIAEIFEVQDQEEEQPHIETVLKLWPFSEDPDEVSITVTKFKWWSRRLKALRSNRIDGEISRNDAEWVKSDESVAAEEDKLEMVCPVCRVFNAATVTAVNAHIDGCLAQAMREERRHMKMNLNPKSKAPKKRSIAEILTVAPQIKARNCEVVEVDKEEEEEEEEEEDGREEKYDYGDEESSGVGSVAVASTIKSKMNTNKNRKKKSKRKLKKKNKEQNYRSVESLNNGKKMMVNKKKKNLFNNKLIAKKEDAYKRKVQSARKLKGTIGNKRVAMDDIDASARTKKSRLKFLSVEKKQKVKDCDSVDKQQKAVPLVRGILKNHLKHFSGRSSSDRNIQDGTEESHCDVQVITSDRHVRFSGKDDILGQKSRNSSDETIFNLSSDALDTLLGKESSGSEEAAILEVNRNDGNIAININNRKEVCPIVEDKQFSSTPEQVAMQNFVRPCTNQEKSEHLVEKPESSRKVALWDNNNLHLFEKGKTTTMHHSPYAGISRTLSAHQAGQISSTSNQMCASPAFSSTVQFADHWKDPTHQVAAVNSNASTRTFLEHSSSYSASNDEENGRHQLPSQSYGDYDNNVPALGDRPLSHMFSAGIIDNSFPLAGWGKGNVRNNYIDENNFGLPLNSYGEFINFSSSGKVGMKQLETSGTLRVSSSGLPVNNIVFQSSHEYLSISEKDFVQKTIHKDSENPFPHYPARLGVTELQNSGRADIHRLTDSNSTSSQYVCPLESELKLMRNPFTEQNQHEQVKKHQGNRMISLKESSDLISLSSSQPTMRLMGKDVPIGRSSKEMQQFVEDVWVNEESRRRHCSEDAALENSLLGRCSKQNLISGSPFQISTENVLQSVKIQSNQASQSTSLMNGPNYEFPQPFLDLQYNYVSQNGSLGVGRNANSYLLPITQAPSSCAVFSRVPHDSPQKFISGAKDQGLGSQLQVVPNPCNFTNSAFEFPFLNPSVEEHEQTSWFQRSYRSLPPRLSISMHEKLPGTHSQQFSGVSRSFPHNKWGENFTAPSVNHSAEVVYPPNPMTSHCQMKTSLCPASIVQPPHVLVTPVTKPSFNINSGYRNIMKVADRVKLDDMTTENHHLCKNTRKRPAANLDDSIKAFKLPNMRVQENLSCMSGLTQENSGAELQWNTGAVKLDPRGDGARSKYYFQNEAQITYPRSYPGIDSFKLDGMASSGPVGLCPGAKHIPRPTQNMEQDNSRPIHSSIPIVATTDHDRDLENQKNITKIYRL